MKNSLKTVAGITLVECESESMIHCIEMAVSNGICLDNADLSDQNLEGINLAGQSIRWANFENATLAFANLQACNLTGSNFRRTNLFNTKLQGAYMKDTDIRGANFSKANLRNVDFRSDVLDAGQSKCNNVTFAESDMTNIIIEGHSFFNCDFSGAKIKHAVLKRTWFNDCNLLGMDMASSRLYDFHINNSDMTNVNLEGVDLTKTEFYNCDISNAYFGFASFPIICGNRNVRTSPDQRTIIANFLLNWLKNDSENLTDKEKELLQLLNDYGSDINYIAAIERTKSKSFK